MNDEELESILSTPLPLKVVPTVETEIMNKVLVLVCKDGTFKVVENDFGAIEGYCCDDYDMSDMDDVTKSKMGKAITTKHPDVTEVWLQDL